MANGGYSVVEYRDARSRSPFRQWLARLRDSKGVEIIAARLDAVRSGNAERKLKPLGGGLRELRIHYGPGYRLYFGQEGRRLYLLLCGGDKSSQPRDIERARAYWQNHKRRQGK